MAFPGCLLKRAFEKLSLKSRSKLYALTFPFCQHTEMIRQMVFLYIGRAVCLILLIVRPFMSLSLESVLTT